MRHTQFMMYQIVNAIQIQHDAGATRTATSQKKGTRIFEAKGNQVPDNLDHDLCPHEGKHVIGRPEGPSAAPTVACAIRNKTMEE